MSRLSYHSSRITFHSGSSITKRRSFFGLLCLLLLSLAGCSHYQLGTGAKLKFKTLFVSPVTSDIVLPQARTLATARLREAFLRDSRITLVDSPDKADATLFVSLKSYGRDSVVARSDDTGLTRKFALQLTAVCTLRTKDGQTLLHEKPLRVQRDAYTDNGQLIAERETLPLILGTLAKDVTSLILDAW